MSVAKIAKLAGVSRMTVSRVINEDPRVRPETARQVRKAIAELDYVPPSPEIDGRRRRARSVSGLHTSRIAVLFPDTNADAMRTTLSGRLLHGIDGPVERKSLQLLLTRLPSRNTLPRCIDRRQVDGVIVRSSDLPWLPVALKGIPYVWVFDLIDSASPCDNVNVDNDSVGRMAVTHLTDQGHRHLAAINDIPGHPAHEQRIKAFVQFARDRNCHVKTLQLADIEIGHVITEMSNLLKSDESPTGLFVPGSGPFISCVQRAVRGAGFEPGQPIDLIGCGHNHYLIEAMYPQPANIDIQPEAIGEAAIDLLLWRLSNPTAACRSTIIQPKLVMPAR